MCGIVGICSLHPDYPVQRERLLQATRLQAHRGPDDEGLLVGRGFGLGNRRLSIIDLTGGHQPMSDPTDRYHITYNGELYNFADLRIELEAKGFAFRTRSDTEVVLNSYIAYGPACLDRFVGMYGLAIWDSQQRRLFLARDRLGIKPLYYALDGSNLVFASETRSIRALLNTRPTLNPNGISSYLAYRYVIGSQTLYREIQALSPGHYLIFEDGKLSVQQYWEIPVVAAPPDHGEAFYQQGIRDKLKQAVKRRLVSDVPVCCFLSGGLDSSIIAYEMAALQSEPINTFAIGFADDPAGNELHYARLVAEHCRTQHTEILLRTDAYLERLPELVRLRDAPLSVPNEIAIYEMSLQLKQTATVVLSGEGADELFAGYGRIFRSPLDFQRMQLLQSDEQVLNGPAREALTSNLRSKYGSLAIRDELTHFLQQYEYCSFNERRRWLDDGLWAATDNDCYCRQVFADAFSTAVPLDLHRRYMWVFEKLHLVGLLQRLDSSTMAASVEGRVPFVDHELVEFAMAMALHYKLRWRSDGHMVMASLLNSDQISETYDVTKYILRSAYRGLLPDAVLDRRKVGFPVPLHHMMGVGFLDYTRSVLLDSSIAQSGLFNTSAVRKLLMQPGSFKEHREALKVWMLLNLALWYNAVWQRNDP